MYGRCETDPFDQATDVCDSCYGEFCAACTVTTKGRKHPICKECTIIASGVRPGAKPLLRGSKKTANKRRKALKAAPPAPRSFEYFDDTDPAGPGPAEPTVDDAAELTTQADEQAADAIGTEEAEVDSAPSPEVPPALAGPSAAPTSSPSTVSPGLAALAQHQAELGGANAEADLSDVPAPDWATEPVEADTELPGQSVTGAMPPASDDASTPTAERAPIDAEAKPVTDGFDWVTELPPRGSAGNLPSRNTATAGGIEESSEQAAGAVATADRPPALPRRRSTLRPPDDSNR